MRPAPYRPAADHPARGLALIGGKTVIGTPGRRIGGSARFVSLQTGVKIEHPALNQRAAELPCGVPGGDGSDVHDPDGIGAAYLEMPDFDGPLDFLRKLTAAKITGEHRPPRPSPGGAG